MGMAFQLTSLGHIMEKRHSTYNIAVLIMQCSTIDIELKLATMQSSNGNIYSMLACEHLAAQKTLYGLVLKRERLTLLIPYVETGRTLIERQRNVIRL